MVKRAVTTRRKVLGNSLVLISAETTTRAISFLTLAYLSRTLTLETMGAVEFGFAVFAIVQVVGTGGVEAIMTPEAARRPEDVPVLAGRNLLIAATLLIVVTLLACFAAKVLDLSPELRTSAALFGAAAIVVPAGMRFVFIAGERVAVIGLANVTAALVFLGCCLLGVNGSEDVARIGMFWILAVAIRTSVGLVAFLRSHGGVVWVTEELRSWLARAATVGLGSVAVASMTSADIVVLGVLCAPDEVARYGLAVKLPLFLVSLVGLFHTAVFPTLVRAVATADDGRIRRIGADAIALGLGIAVPGAIALGLGAEPVVRLLFGERFVTAGPILAVTAWRLPLATVAGFFRNVVWARSAERDARIEVAVFVATLFALPFGAHYAGALGVAVCMIAGNLLAIALLMRAAAVPRLGDWSMVLRLAIATVATTVLMRVIAPGDGVAAVAALGLCWAVGAAIASAPLLARVRPFSSPPSA